MVTKETPRESNAPEGGWGWFVVVAYSLNNMIILPVIQIFGFLYKDLFHELKMNTVNISLIITINCSFGMLLAIFNGPMLKIFGFRKIAIVGALFIFAGNFMTSQSTTLIEFIIYFGILVSIGTNCVMAAFNLALNTYFVSKRGVATGIAMSITGLGPIAMPHIVSFLMKEYGINGSGLILSALSLHSLAAAILLQPVKWHRKQLKIHDDTQENKTVVLNNYGKAEKSNAEDIELNDLNEDDEPSPASKLVENEVTSEIIIVPPASNDLTEDDAPPVKSLDDVVKPVSFKKRLVNFFDLDLLRDPIYVNISVGLACAFVSEMNFTLMLPFILEDRGLLNDDIVILLSTLAAADIFSRFFSPFVTNSVKSQVRLIYLFSLCCGIIIRICLLYSYSFVSVLIVTIGLGITKGIRSVYTALVIPNYVPLRKLATATGFQMVSNGLFLAICGPLLGKLRDVSKNYDNWIHVINCLTLATIFIWAIEIFLLHRGKKVQAKKPIVIKRQG